MRRMSTVRTFKRALYALAIVAVAMTMAAAGGGYAVLLPSLGGRDGARKVAGLQATVEVVRDRWGIPHIYAQGEEDLFFAQGYVHAQDRLWQMELARRAARGTLAEALGASVLAGDRLARALGFAQAAEAEWSQMAGEERAVLAAYARGVNAFLEERGRLPIEFRLLGLEPTPWQPQDTLAWARLLAWCLDGGWRQELVRARLVQAVGAERAAELDPALAEEEALLAGPGYLAGLPAATLLEAGAGVWPWAGRLDGLVLAVGGERAAEGGAILAAAPRLPVQMPSPWYEVHLAGGRYDVIGAGFPGLPGVAMGRNQRLAWGLCGATGEGVDLYVERVRPGDPPQVELDGRWEPVALREETIRVRGQAEPERVAIYGTRHGPLVGALEPGGEVDVALRWAGDGQPAALARAILAVNRAASWHELQAALVGWAAPLVTIVYADAAGQVGYVSAGAVPERAGTAGKLPLPGWEAEHEWRRLVTAQELPHEERGRGSLLAGTGGAFTPPGWPEHAANGAQAVPAVTRVSEWVQGRQKLTLSDVKAIQRDDWGLERPLLAQLLAMPPQGWLQERTLPHLRTWDGRYDAESVGAGVYETFLWKVAHNTWDDELGAELVDVYLNACPGYRGVLARLAAEPDAPWFDDARTPEREGRDAILARSFADAVEWLGRRFGDLPYEWNWGRVHNVTFRHALGQTWPLNLLVNRGAMRAGGGPASLEAVTSDHARGLAVREVPFFMAIDLAPGGRAEAMNSTGQVGNPLSAHYADMIEPWRKEGYHPLLYEREAVLQAREATLTLAP